jgi:phage terminase large subunit
MRFDKKWFNPLYFILKDIFADNSIRTVLVYGGKSSSKTVSISQILVKECLMYGASSIAFRKQSTIIPTTIKKSLRLAINSTRLNNGFIQQDRRFLSKTNGGEIVMKGLDDEEKAKGVESFKYVYADELNQFEQSEWEQMDMSLRGIPGQKMIGTWNPVDELSWIKTEVIDKTEWLIWDKYKLPSEQSFVKISADGKTVLIRTMYEDNYWIVGSPCGTYGYRDENLIALYEGMRTRNYNSYKVNVLGEWGKTVYGGEFLKSWKSELHVDIVPYDPGLAIYLYFDENVSPYFPCAFFQVSKDEKQLRMIHCIAAKTPDNRTKPMGRMIIRKLREYQHKEHIYIGGDATSRKEDVKQEKGHDLFRLMINELDDYKPHNRVSKSNPSVRLSGDYINEILEGKIEDLSFVVDKSCLVAIKDFEYTLEDKNGHIDKTTVKDPITEVSYQPYGHFVDIARYAVTTIFNVQYARYQSGTKTGTMQGGKNRSSNNW